MSHAIFRAVTLWGFLRHPRLVEKFRRKTGHFPNIASPRTVQEKFLWRKIFDHDPRFVRVQDKLAVKDHARAILPEIGVPDTLWSGADLAQAPRDVLSRAAVLKPNHDCGKVVFLPDPDLSFADLEAVTRGWMQKRYGKRKGEWAYKWIVPRLMIEEKLENRDGAPLNEIKVYVCGGKAVLTACYAERSSEAASVMIVLPDRSINRAKIDSVVPQGRFEIDPAFDTAVRMAEALGRDFDFIRIDLFVVDGRVFVGEFTVYPRSGFHTFRDAELEADWARLWDLRKSRFLSTRQPGWRGLYARALRAHLDSRGG